MLRSPEKMALDSLWTWWGGIEREVGVEKF